MDFFHILKVIGLILFVLFVFNIMIFVHELGHFLAGRWRGLKIDRFQIWFGEPIWKKTIRGVQYGLGWIPAGGFVSLPQMAPMESVEGKVEGAESLPPISPLDKIIVAFAGPLFSMLLAFTCACIIYFTGKPQEFMPTQVVGYVQPASPAEKAGFQVGDEIIRINGQEVKGFRGSLESITESIVLSKGNELKFDIIREGKTIQLTSLFEVKDAPWYKRSSFRTVGIGPVSGEVMIASVIKGSPAEKAGLKEGDVISSMNGEMISNSKQLTDLLKSKANQEVALRYQRYDQSKELSLKPLIPLSPQGLDAMIGASLLDVPYVESKIVKPNPWDQITSSLRMMYTTIDRLISKDSNINLSHMNGPIGMAKAKYELLLLDHPILRILAFMVIINVNLAIFNLFPLPVLDGGHITLAILEAISRRPLQPKILEIIQTSFALIMMGLFLYVTSKDVSDLIPGGKKAETDKQPTIVFPQ